MKNARNTGIKAADILTGAKFKNIRTARIAVVEGVFDTFSGKRVIYRYVKPVADKRDRRHKPHTQLCTVRWGNFADAFRPVKRK